MVGTSGIRGTRDLVVTASAFSLPAFTRPAIEATVTGRISTSPASNAVVAGPAPLYGTSRTFMPRDLRNATMMNRPGDDSVAVP